MTTRRHLLVVACAAAVLTCAAPAAAQVHLQFIGGTADAATQQPFFAGAIGFRLSFLELDFEGGHFKDIVPSEVMAALNDLQRQSELPVEVIASVPATYGLAQVRLIPGIGPFRPFIGGGFGMARLSPRVEVVADGVSLGDVFGLTSFAPQTEPMAMASAGIRLDGGVVHVEGGYRYVAVFSDFRPRDPSSSRILTHVNCWYGALGVRF